MSAPKAKESSQHEIQYGRHRIVFSLIFSDRRHMEIQVQPTKSIRVVAPIGKQLDDILRRVRKRAPWILKQLDYFERFQPLPTPRRFVSGETHLYLGRQYRLKVSSSDDDVVKLKGKYIHVLSSAPKSTEHTRHLVEAWYSEHAKNLFVRHLEKCLQSTSGLKVSTPRLIVRRMKTRWGSCSKAGNLVLNTDLVKAPADCIDYVIMHELCHLRIREHTPAFYRLLSRCMPDWERRKARLEKVVL